LTENNDPLQGEINPNLRLRGRPKIGRGNSTSHQAHDVGIAGLGGLGHVAIQLAKARGARRVVALTTTPAKRSELLSTIPTAFDMNP